MILLTIDTLRFIFPALHRGVNKNLCFLSLRTIITISTSPFYKSIFPLRNLLKENRNRVFESFVNNLFSVGKYLTRFKADKVNKSEADL